MIAYFELAQKRRGQDMAEFAGSVRAAFHASKKQFQKLLKDVTRDG